MSFLKNKKFIIITAFLTLVFVSTPLSAQEENINHDEAVTVENTRPRAMKKHDGEKRMKHQNKENKHNVGHEKKCSNMDCCDRRSKMKHGGEGKPHMKEHMEKIISELPPEIQSQCNSCKNAIDEHMEKKREERQKNRENRRNRLSTYLEEQGIDVDNITDEEREKIKELLSKRKKTHSNETSKSNDGSNHNKTEKRSFLNRIFNK